MLYCNNYSTCYFCYTGNDFSKEEKEMRATLLRLNRDKEESKEEMSEVKHFLAEIERAEQVKDSTKDPAARRTLAKKTRQGIQKLLKVRLPVVAYISVLNTQICQYMLL